MAATMAIAIKITDTILQTMPQHCEDPPYLSAKTLASDVFTFRRMRSSHYKDPESVEKEERDTRSSQYPKHYIELT